MLPDKIKLSPESKRTFLELGLKHATKKQKSATDEQKKSLLYNFVKMLCVKKSYLYCHYPIDPQFYRLSMCFGNNSDRISILLTSKDYFFNGNIVYLTYDVVYKLINLLLQSYIVFSFSDDIADALVFGQYLRLLKFTKRKIGLFMDRDLEKQFVQTLLGAFSDRICALYCYMDQLEAAGHLQFPVFDSLDIGSIENSGQISRALKFKTKELILRDFAENFTIVDSYLVNLDNETIKKLRLNFERVNYVEIEKLVKQLHKCCSNLKDFVLQVDFVPFNEESSNQVPDHVFSYVKRMNDLKACFENSLASMSIDFNFRIDISGERDKTWIKAISDKSELKHWKFTLSEKYLGDFEYRDTLKMELVDARCKLKMTIRVFTRRADDEDQTSDDDNNLPQTIETIDSEDQTSDDEFNLTQTIESEDSKDQATEEDASENQSSEEDNNETQVSKNEDSKDQAFESDDSEDQITENVDSKDPFSEEDDSEDQTDDSKDQTSENDDSEDEEMDGFY